MSDTQVRWFAVLLALFGALLGALIAFRPAALLGVAVFLASAWTFSLLFNPAPRREQVAGVLLPVLVGAPALAVRAGAPAGVAGLAVGGLIVAAAVVIVARPSVGRPVQSRWMTAAEPIGWSVSFVALGLAYHLVLTPVGIALRLAGHDPMRRRAREEASHWVEIGDEPPPERYLRQF